MKFLLPIAAAFALAGCASFHPTAAPEPEASVPGQAYHRVEIADKVATPAERAACDAVGGEISRQGLLGTVRAVLPGCG